MTDKARPGGGPNRDAALAQYRKRASVYDLELALFEPIRRRAVALLAPQPGQTLLDVGCGTGLSLPLLHAAVGAGGQVVGIEQSPEMIELARQRVHAGRWRGVRLVEASVESALLPADADGALFHFTHDILRRPEAVANILSHLRPGARVVAAGLKWAPAWAWMVNAAVLPAALRSVSSLEGLARPWSHLESRLGPMQLQSLLGGGVFLALGEVRQP